MSERHKRAVISGAIGDLDDIEKSITGYVFDVDDDGNIYVVDLSADDIERLSNGYGKRFVLAG